MARMATLLLVFAVTLCLAAGDPATYRNGTVSAIPANSAGQLDLSDTEAFSFRHGSETFSVPYDRIVNVRLGKEDQSVSSKVSSGAATVGRTVLPMFFSPKTKYLTIEFEGEGSRPESLVLEMSAKEAKAAMPVLEARRTQPEPEVKLEGPLYHDANWWGNSIWRTNRNKHLWPERQEEAKESQSESEVQVAAGKE